MALDNNAGTKRTVSLMRNLTPSVPAESVVQVTAAAPEIATVVTAANLDGPSYQRKNEVPSASSATTTHTPSTARAGYAAAPSGSTKPAAQQSIRTKKVSFLADPKLEERFRKARLRAGFDKLEDAYNEALTVFCEQVEKGLIDRF